MTKQAPATHPTESRTRAMRLSAILWMVAGDLLGPTCDLQEHLLPQPVHHHQLLPPKSAPPPHGSPRIPRPTTGDAFDSLPVSPDWAEPQVPGHERIPSAATMEEDQVTVAADACRQKPTSSHLEDDGTAAGHQGAADVTTETRSSDGSTARRTGNVVIITQSRPPETTPPGSTVNISSPASTDAFLPLSDISTERRTVLWAGIAMGVVGLIMCSF